MARTQKIIHEILCFADIPIDIRDIEEINTHPKGAEGFLSSMEENLITLKRQVCIVYTTGNNTYLPTISRFRSPLRAD